MIGIIKMEEGVFLLGMMGSGKSSLARKLGIALGRKCIDLDTEIEQYAGLHISSIFKQYGEAHFRTLESEVLKNIPLEDAPIVALGGGTPCFNNNMEYLKSHGVSIYLREEIEILTRRIYGDSRRPLVADKSKDEVRAILANMLQQREAYYCKADYILPSGSLDDHISCFFRILDTITQK